MHSKDFDEKVKLSTNLWQTIKFLTGSTEQAKCIWKRFIDLHSLEYDGITIKS